MNSIFIAGTDTGVGKTICTVALIQKLNKNRYKTFGLKPIASGCYYDDQGNLVSDDALAIQNAISIKTEYTGINPIVYQEAIAPHIAAKKSGRPLSVDFVVEKIAHSIRQDVDFNIIEGVGGWSVPINNIESMSDVVRTLNIPTILVVGMRLGCINHAILTSQGILQKNVPLLGWLANCIDNSMLELTENINTLMEWIPAPCLGVVPYSEKKDRTSDIDVRLLIQQLSKKKQIEDCHSDGYSICDLL